MKKHCMKICLLPVISAVLFVAVATTTARCEQESKEKTTISVDFLSYKECSTPPILTYRGSRGHHGQWISDSDIEEVLIWADGTIAWQVAPDEKQRWDSYWYQATVPAEKIEAAVKIITEDFEKYPIKDRPRESRIFYHLGANYSPTIGVYAPADYETMWIEHYWMEFYKKNKETFQSGDREAMLKKFKEMTDMRGHEMIVNYYRDKLPDAGLAKSWSPMDDDEIFKCIGFYVADVEHLLLMEKTILDLLPPTEGLEKTKNGDDFRHYSYIRADREIKDGKPEFSYVIITEKERDEIYKEWHEAKEKK